MKKILIMMFVAAVATNINAQLVVDSLGRVDIGTLYVGGNENGDKVIGASTHPGSKIVLNNGAQISKPFATPLGVEFVINNGSIE